MAKEHFLSEYVEGKQEFVSELWYNPYGDRITFQTADETVATDRINELLTIYRSAITEKAIGFKIKGVQGILNKFGYDGLAFTPEQEGTTVKSISIKIKKGQL